MASQSPAWLLPLYLLVSARAETELLQSLFVPVPLVHGPCRSEASLVSKSRRGLVLVYKGHHYRPSQAG